MKAVVRSRAGVRLETVDAPLVERPDEVVIQVACAGICRTDLYVASGRIPTRDGMVLGHELSGRIARVGTAVRDFREGDRVGVIPRIPCGTCPACRHEDPRRCHTPSWLGIDLPGAFAEYVRVPARSLLRLPDTLPWRLGAYVEPVAAALAVLNAGLERRNRILLHGQGRITTLCARVLAAHGFEQVARAPSSGPPPACAFDVVIETGTAGSALAEVLSAVRPGGKVVLKSRPPDPAALDFRLAVDKELTFRAVGYGDFEEAIALLDTHRLEVEDLLGATFALEDWETAFATASGESSKIFLRPGPETI